MELRDYFDKPIAIEEIIEKYDVIWVIGGNAFVLMQAMKLSGLNAVIKKMYENNVDILYGGFSAGTYILGPTLKGFHLVDDPDQKSYGNQYETIWDGLGILNYAIVPHYRSEHFESEAMEMSVLQKLPIGK